MLVIRCCCYLLFNCVRLDVLYVPPWFLYFSSSYPMNSIYALVYIICLPYLPAGPVSMRT